MPARAPQETGKRTRLEGTLAPHPGETKAIMMREDCDKCFFVSFDYSSDALQEIESFFKRSHKIIVALTVKEILE